MVTYQTKKSVRDSRNECPSRRGLVTSSREPFVLFRIESGHIFEFKLGRFGTASRFFGAETRVRFRSHTDWKSNGAGRKIWEKRREPVTRIFFFTRTTKYYEFPLDRLSAFPIFFRSPFVARYLRYYVLWKLSIDHISSCITQYTYTHSERDANGFSPFFCTRDLAEKL